MTFKMASEEGRRALQHAVANSTDGIYVISRQGFEFVNPGVRGPGRPDGR